MKKAKLEELLLREKVEHLLRVEYSLRGLLEPPISELEHAALVDAAMKRLLPPPEAAPVHAHRPPARPVKYTRIMADAWNVFWMLDSLPTFRERVILLERFGFNGRKRKSQRQCGKMFGIGPARVWQIQCDMFIKIREALTRKMQDA